MALALWPVFDLFEFAERIEFEDNVLAIFNHVLGAEKHLAHRHFRFLPHFHKIYQKQNGFGELTRTVTLMLTKGRDHLLGDEEGRKDLGELADFIKSCYGVVKKEESLTYVLTFLQYLYLEYGSALAADHPLRERVLEEYFEKKGELGDESKAAIINFLLIWHYVYGEGEGAVNELMKGELE